MSIDSSPFVRKVCAFIVRQHTKGFNELLVHAFAFDLSIPFRVPGGGIEAGETPQEALYREILEESGLDALQLGRKIGVARYYKAYIEAHVERHDFLLYAPATSPDSWAYRVTGSDKDADELFLYRWLPAHDLHNISEELRTFLNPTDLPELF